MESTEFVVDFVTTAGAMGTDDEDDKTISQKDDKHIKCTLGTHYLAQSCAISRYLSLSRKAPDLCTIFANRNKALINKFNSISKFTTMGTFNNNSTWGKVLNIVITILTAIATTFGAQSCM